MAVSSSNFIRHLEASGLFGDPDLALARAKASNPGMDGQSLAVLLVKKGKLTPYQAKQLLAGHSAGFFLEKYKILEPIGRGGMGLVFKAEHTILRRNAAIKVLPRSNASNPEAVARFRREACAIAQLEHENVVRVYDVGVQGKAHFFAMEFVEGQSLSKLLKSRGRLPYREAVSVIYQVALGLEHAFSRGIIHRDIKPSNIIVTPQGKSKILDMGLIRHDGLFAERSLSQQTLTNSGSVLGTVDYVAPEQAEDSHKADVRSDLYSLGCTLYECLTGRVPFHGGTMMQKLLKHYREKPSDIRQSTPDVPLELVAIVDRLMAKRPEDRFQTPTELARALTPFLGSLAPEKPFVPHPGLATKLTQTSTADAGSQGVVANIEPSSVAAAAEEKSQPTLPTIPLGTPKLSRPEPTADESHHDNPPPTSKQVVKTTNTIPVPNATTPTDQPSVAMPFGVSRPESAKGVEHASSCQPCPSRTQGVPRTRTILPKDITTQPSLAAPKSNGDGKLVQSATDSAPSTLAATSTNSYLTSSDILAAIAAAVSEAPPYTSQTKSSRDMISGRKYFLLFSSAVAILILGVALVVWVTSRPGTLLLIFPESYWDDAASRSAPETGRVLLDGRPLPTDGRERASFSVETGQHRLRVEMQGIIPVNKFIWIRRGKSELVELVPTAQTLRRRELRRLASNIEAVKSDDPNDDEVVRLRNELSDYLEKIRDSDEAMDAVSLKARLPWPIDSLREIDISLPSKSANGDPAFRPAVVAILPLSGPGQQSPYTSQAFSSDGQRFAFGREDGKVEILELGGAKAPRVVENLGRSVAVVAFSKEGQSLTCASEEEIKIRGLDNGLEQGSPGRLKGRYSLLASSADGKTIAGAREDGTIAVHAAAANREPGIIQDPATPILALAISSNGKVLALSSQDVIQFWDLVKLKNFVPKNVKHEVTALAFSSNDSLLALVCRDGTARVWRVNSLQEITKLEECTCLAFMPDGKSVAAAKQDGTVQLVTIPNGEVQCSLDLKPFVSPIRQLAFSPEGRHLAIMGSNSPIHIIRLSPPLHPTPHE